MRSVALLLLAAPAALGAQADTGAFIVRLGRDTVAVERFRRGPGRLEADLIARDQVPVVRYHYVATLTAGGAVSRFEQTNTRLFAGGATGPGARAVLVFNGDSVTGTLTLGDSTRPVRADAPGGGLPYVTEETFALFEQYGRRARALGGDHARLTAVRIDGRRYELIATPRGADSMTIGFAGDPPTRLRVDAAGRVLGVDGRTTADKVVAERVANADIDALAAAFAGRPLGVLSPPDSVRVTLDGAAITVDYSRPALRGRRIFGDAVVPWGVVWRTGANEATRFTTTADLVVAGRRLPAGAYSLWTLPSPAGWTLIFNRQTRAPCGSPAACGDARRPPLWGTDYSADSDFVRLPMRVERLARPVERFTIRVEPRGGRAALVLEWETTRAWVELAKR